MEGYKFEIKNFAVPSVPIFFFAAASVLFFYDCRSEGLNTPFLIFLIAFLVSFLFTVSSYVSLISRYSLKGYSLLILVSVLSGLFILSVVSWRISALSGLTDSPELLNNPVIKITEKRFRRSGLELNFTTSENNENYYRGILFIKGEADIETGDVVVLHGKVKRQVPGTGNLYADNLIRQGFFYRGYAAGDDITVVERNTPLRDRVRNNFFTAIDNVFPAKSGSVIKALYSGNRNFISSGTILDFRDAGVMHILAASGLHVGIVAALPLIFYFAGINRKVLLTVSLFLVVFYLYLTDMPVSLIRASVMFFLVYLQIIFNREVKALNSLFLAGIIILLLFPWQLYTPGFQLSFGATAGIIIFYKGYMRVFRNFPGFIGKSFSATLAAQAVTVPLLYIHMNQFNLASLPANLAAVPLTGGLMVSSAFALFLYPFSTYLAVSAGKCSSLIYELLVFMTDFFAGLSLNFNPESGTLVIISSLIIVFVPFLGFKGKPVYSISVLLLAMLIPFTAFTRTYSLEMKLITITSGKSNVEITSPACDPEINLRIADYDEGRRIFKQLKFYNVEPSVLNINNYTYANIVFSKMILNNFRIDEVVIDQKISVKWGMEDIYDICDREKIELSIKNDYNN